MNTRERVIKAFNRSPGLHDRVPALFDLCRQLPIILKKRWFMMYLPVYNLLERELEICQSRNLYTTKRGNKITENNKPFNFTNFKVLDNKVRVKVRSGSYSFTVAEN